MRVGVLLVAFWLTLYALAAAQRFHPDEAFYMTFARNAAVNGDWWLQGALDKPPLTIYLYAVGLVLFAVDPDANGVLYLDVYKGEFAARITGVLVGVFCVAALMRLAYRLYWSPRCAAAAGLLLALSPYMLAFAPTAFTDMPMLCLSLVSCLFAVQCRPFASGSAFILAFAAKPQAIFFVPLILAFQPVRWSTCSSDVVSFRSIIVTFLRWVFPVLLGGGLLWLWDTLRPATSVFVLGAINNSHAALLSELTDIPTRWMRLWRDAQWLLGTSATTGGMLMVALLGAVTSKNRFNRFTALWIVGYGLLHLVTTLNLYDRYWLLWLPGLALLAASSPLIMPNPKTAMKKGLRYGVFMLKKILLVMLVLLLFYMAVFTRLPIGGDKGRYAGIDELAAYLNAKPIATVIYDRWLGWQLGYYMGQWTNKRRVYFPTPHALAEGAAALDETGIRYLIAPVWEDVRAWITALRAAGFTVTLETRIAQFAVYALLPPNAPR